MKTLTLKQIAKMLNVSDGRANHLLRVALIKNVGDKKIKGSKYRVFDQEQVLNKKECLLEINRKIDRKKENPNYKQSKVNEKEFRKPEGYDLVNLTMNRSIK
jgi:hypothetical protein